MIDQHLLKVIDYHLLKVIHIRSFPQQNNYIRSKFALHKPFSTTRLFCGSK